jgi:hypothetical protein
MGEIKSTMDIVMEKTRGLTMTDEERTEIQRSNAKRKVLGLLQKLLDGIITPENFKVKFHSLEESLDISLRELLIEECVSLMDPEDDNTALFGVMEEVAGLNVDPFRRVLQEFRLDVKTLRKRHEQILADDLWKAGISGSAVIPNIGADRKWTQELSNRREEFMKKINVLVGKTVMDKGLRGQEGV